MRFMHFWPDGTSFEAVGDEGLAAFVAAHQSSHLFDVSDDAATGQKTCPWDHQDIWHQSDPADRRSIARYHVPVILFDHESGSRAAFAAYWLKLMGFAVCVVYLDSRLSVARLRQVLTKTSPSRLWFCPERP